MPPQLPEYADRTLPHRRALTVLRQRKPVTLAVTMPERPETGNVFHWATPAIAPVPPAPPAGAMPTPGVRVSPEGAGTLE